MKTSCMSRGTRLDTRKRVSNCKISNCNGGTAIQTALCAQWVRRLCEMPRQIPKLSEILGSVTIQSISLIVNGSKCKFTILKILPCIVEVLRIYISCVSRRDRLAKKFICKNCKEFSNSHAVTVIGYRTSGPIQMIRILLARPDEIIGSLNRVDHRGLCRHDSNEKWNEITYARGWLRFLVISDRVIKCWF